MCCQLLRCKNSPTSSTYQITVVTEHGNDRATLVGFLSGCKCHVSMWASNDWDRGAQKHPSLTHSGRKRDAWSCVPSYLLAAQPADLGCRLFWAIPTYTHTPIINNMPALRVANLQAAPARRVGSSIVACAQPPVSRTHASRRSVLLSAPAGAAAVLLASAQPSLAKQDAGDWSSPGLATPVDDSQPKFYKTVSGVKIQELSAGSGPEAKEGSTVLFDYVLRRSNGYFIYGTIEGVSFQVMTP